MTIRSTRSFGNAADLEAFLEERDANCETALRVSKTEKTSWKYLQDGADGILDRMEIAVSERKVEEAKCFDLDTSHSSVSARHLLASSEVTDLLPLMKEAIFRRLRLALALSTSAAVMSDPTRSSTDGGSIPEVGGFWIAIFFKRLNSWSVSLADFIH